MNHAKGKYQLKLNEPKSWIVAYSEIEPLHQRVLRKLSEPPCERVSKNKSESDMERVPDNQSEPTSLNVIK